MKHKIIWSLVTATAVVGSPLMAGEIIHDAEHYVLEAQHGEQWAAEDTELDQKLAELRERFGRPPNIIHVMWDDTAYGDVGIPAIQSVRGLDTPNLNTLAEEGILFSHMYTEVGCTPSRAAVVTGRLAVRSGMYNIGMLLEMHGMRDEEVTLAEVLSEAGYATAFHGKWHLGDIEESYPHNQGFDEVFFTGYNQATTRSSLCGPGRVKPATEPWGCTRTCCHRTLTSSTTPSLPRTGSRSLRRKRERRHTVGEITPTRTT